MKTHPKKSYGRRNVTVAWRFSRTRVITLLFLLLTLTISLSAQDTPTNGQTRQPQTLTDFYKAGCDNVHWLGIDYAHVQLTGDFSQFRGAGQKNAEQIRDIYFPAWNKVILNEPDKYKLKEMLHKDTITIDIQMVMRINAEADVEQMERFTPEAYDAEDIREFVAAFDTGGREGFGVLFIAESLNKISEEGIFWYVIMDMSTGEVLWQKRLIAKPGGFGLRNYWIEPLFKIMKQIRKEKYENWALEYGVRI